MHAQRTKKKVITTNKSAMASYGISPKPEEIMPETSKPSMREVAS